MRCERVQELFSDYYEDGVPAALVIPLENHLHECDSCREEFDGLKRVWPILDAAPVVSPPDNFRATVWQRIEAQEAAKRETSRKSVFGFDWRALFPRPALGWATAVLAVIVLSGVVVPGVYTPARLWLPWSAFSTRQETPPAPVRVGQPTVFDGPAGAILKIRVQNPGRTPVIVDVKVESGAVDKDRVTFSAPSGADGWFVVTGVKAGETQPIRVNTSWKPAAQ